MDGSLRVPLAHGLAWLSVHLSDQLIGAINL